jgi:hypothetical protein
MATHAEQMVEKLEQMLLENAGLTEVTVDGQKVAYADLEAKLDHWQAKVREQRSGKATVSRIRLDRF